MRLATYHCILSFTIGCICCSGCATTRNGVSESSSSRIELDVSRTTAGESDAKLDVRADKRTHSVPHDHLVEQVVFQEGLESITSQGEGPSGAALIEGPSESESEFESPRGVVDSERFTLQYLEEIALKNNPAIRQGSAVASKASGIRTQVGLKPNPQIGFFGEEIGDGGTAGLQGAFVSQTFIRGDKLGWNQQVIGHDVERIRWQVEAQRQRVLTDVRVQFYEALAAQRRLELAHEFRNVAQKGVEISQERIRGQVGTRPDLLQSEIQLSEVDLTIQQAQFELNAAWQELAAVAGMPDMVPTELVGELATANDARDAESVYSQIISQSPVVAAAYAQVKRAKSNMERQRVQPIPNVTAQVGVGHNYGSGDEFANVQLSLPLPVHNKNQGNIQAAYAEYCEATQNVERLKMEIRRELAQAIRAYQVAGATVRQYEDSILPRADETLQLIQEGQKAGQFDFLRVLTARRTYFDANLNYVRALGNLAQANAQIDGLLLTGGLSNVLTYDGGDDLRGQTLNGR